MTIIRYRSADRDGARPQTLEERLLALEGAEAARAALAKYADAVDSQDLDLFSALLASDVRLSIGGQQHQGRETVIDFFRNAFAADPAPKSHFVANVKTRWLGNGLVDVDCYFLWTARENQKSIIGWGTYANQIRAGDGEARFTRIEIDIRHMGDVGDGWTIGSDS